MTTTSSRPGTFARTSSGSSFATGPLERSTWRRRSRAPSWRRSRISSSSRPSQSTPRSTLSYGRRLYERSNVTEYWVVDPDIDVVRIYRCEGERFARPIELSREVGDVLTTPLLPGLEIPLSRVFE